MKLVTTALAILEKADTWSPGKKSREEKNSDNG